MADPTKTRKPWTRPELIVLVRGRPEEAVLVTCKEGFTGSKTGPSNGDTACLNPRNSCAMCSADSPS